MLKSILPHIFEDEITTSKVIEIAFDRRDKDKNSRNALETANFKKGMHVNTFKKKAGVILK